MSVQIRVKLLLIRETKYPFFYTYNVGHIATYVRVHMLVWHETIGQKGKEKRA